MAGYFTGFHSVAVGALGISNDSHVVVYDRSDSGIFSSPRVWWTFRYFGHDNVSVLNGGWQHWLKEGFPVDSSTEFAHPRVPLVVPSTSHTPSLPRKQMATFRVRDVRSELVRDQAQMLANITSHDFQVMDARANGR